MIWDISTFLTEYGLSISVTVAGALLADAESAVQDYISTAAYADAISATPEDENAARKIRRAIGDLALVYGRQRNLMPPTAETYSESYSGVVSYSMSTGKTGLSTSMTEEAILGRLAAYAASRAALAGGTGDSWGTGRFVGVYTTEDDD